MDRRRVAELKLSNEESQKFQKAIEHYKILNSARYLFVCYQMLVEHHEAGDQIIVPPRLMTVEALIRLEAAIQALDRLEVDPTRVRKADATKSKTLQESGKNQKKRKSSRKSKDPGS